jgi:BASS family bile acid:Na+ symporter
MTEPTTAWPIAAAAILFAIGFQAYRVTRPFALGAWVLSSVVAAYFAPQLFLSWFGEPAKGFVGPLIQVAMLGMGATLTFSDFSRVWKMPLAVAVGMILQFTVMPLTGWTLATAFRLPPEFAVGVILIGACPGGVASNVITYLARGNVPLSVTMTTCSTMAAPIMTPLMLGLLAGRIVEIPVMQTVLEILQIVILPIAVGLAVNKALHQTGWKAERVEPVLAAVSMISICLICAIIVANARDALNQVGLWFIGVVVLHNFIGYFAGYWGARLAGLPESACRTVAIEVGMQNGGMGATLATNVLKSSSIALASAIFGSWMTIAGSVLAVYWRKRPAMADKGTGKPPR